MTKRHMIDRLCRRAVASIVILSGTLVQGGHATFEVATIKPSRLSRLYSEGGKRERIVIAPNAVQLDNVSLSDCVQFAYNVKVYQVFGPDWLSQERYDIAARAGQPASKAELRVMLQAFLAERFQLKLHRETRTGPVYALVVHKTAPRLRPAQSGQTAGMSVLDGSIAFQHVTMPEFAELLSGLAAIDRPVVDKTDLEGAFDITLKSAARGAPEDTSSIFAAVEEVGFKLERRKGPVEVLIVDHADKPSRN
jgi:uncharacterized protein (TIGR03435 family)